mmetsp:Transcript_23492/g.66874  ORF Transcript_23492/g.66874 Transcript_23492/m.66874 type:complete len:238 (-) Transcript_23492:1661-2374(-)
MPPWKMRPSITSCNLLTLSWSRAWAALVANSALNPADMSLVFITGLMNSSSMSGTSRPWHTACMEASGSVCVKKACSKLFFTFLSTAPWVHAAATASANFPLAPQLTSLCQTTGLRMFSVMSPSSRTALILWSTLMALGKPVKSTSCSSGPSSFNFSSVTFCEAFSAMLLDTPSWMSLCSSAGETNSSIKPSMPRWSRSVLSEPTMSSPPSTISFTCSKMSPVSICFANSSPILCTI